MKHSSRKRVYFCMIELELREPLRAFSLLVNPSSKVEEFYKRDNLLRLKTSFTQHITEFIDSVVYCVKYGFNLLSLNVNFLHLLG